MRALIWATVLLLGCGGGDREPAPPGNLDPEVEPIVDGAWARLPVATTWQWHIQGAVNTTHDVEVYDVDLFEVSDAVIGELHAAGRQVICYFSAGSFEDFRPDAGEFDPRELGNTLDGFADERWLDVRSANVHRIMNERLDLAVTRGCDGVEPDNVTAFSDDSGFELSAIDQLAFNRFVFNGAHQRELAVALKNDLVQIPELIDYVDFAVNEQCHEFGECENNAPFVAADKAVLNAEYAAVFVDDSAARDAMCAEARDADHRTLVLPENLDDSFRFSCDL